MGSFVFCFHRPQLWLFLGRTLPDQLPSRRKQGLLVCETIFLSMLQAGQIGGRGAAASALQHSLRAGPGPGAGSGMCSGPPHVWPPGWVTLAFSGSPATARRLSGCCCCPPGPPESFWGQPLWFWLPLGRMALAEPQLLSGHPGSRGRGVLLCLSER